MKHTLSRRLLSVLLALAILLTVFAGLSAYAAAPSATSIGKNTAKRHVVCTALSEAAEAYYPAGSTYNDLIALPGIKTNSSVEAIGSPLFNKLQSMMQPKDTISYSALTSYWKYTDASDGSSDACLFYSDEISSSYNREHVWPKSRGNFYQSGAGCDIQHLRPTNATINSTRSNMTMGNVRSKEGYTVKTAAYEGKTVLWYISNYADNDCDGLVEVADNIKGDVARIYLYVYTTYGAENANKNLFTKCGSYGASDNDGKKVIESLDTLLEWCAIDPVDEWEMMRNDLCQKVQGNRNIFIDYPELGWYLFGREDEIPGDMPTPSGMASGTTPSSYTITAVSNNEAWGTVALNGKIIDASPAEGYYAAGYEILDGEATVTQSGNRFAISPQSDCTVQINFAQKDVCSLTYYSNGERFMQSTVYTGEELSLPTSAPAFEGWRFMGWTETELTGEVVERPAYYEPGAAYMPLGDTDLYALYTKVDESSPGETDSYQLLTEKPDTLEGSYVLTSDAADYVLLCDGSETLGSSAAAIVLGSTGMTKDGNTLKNVSDKYVLIVEHVSGNNYSFRLKGADTPLYMMTTDANGGFNAVDSRDSLDAQWTISINNGGAVISNAAYTSRSIRFNIGSHMFRTYTSGQAPVYLWKSVAGGQVFYATSPVSVVHEHECALAEAKEPTCTKDGCIEHLYCSICGKCFSLEKYNETGELVELSEQDVVIPALGHDFGDWSEATAPTCTEKGVETRACSRCDATETRDVDVLGHSYEAVLTGPTCTEGGYTTHTCTRCGDSYVDSETDALGHSWGEGVVTAEPTEDAEGEMTFTCTRCGATTTEVIPKNDHEHDYQPVVTPPTCAEPGYTTYTCTKCGASYVDDYVDALGHDWGDWTELDVPTCTEKGVELRACARCGATEEREIDALGHTYVDGVCINCGEADPDYKPEEPQPENPFEDVDEEEDWFADAVLWATTQDPPITNGTDENHFSPSNKCTRAEIVQFLWNAAGKPDVGGGVLDAPQNPFTDISEDDWYYTAVMWAVNNKITNGTDATHFSPTKRCTRAEVVMFLWNAAGKPEIAEGTNNPFDDVPADAWCKDAVLWAVAEGITSGTTPTTFAPTKVCTRAEVVQFLYKAS